MRADTFIDGVVRRAQEICERKFDFEETEVVPALSELDDNESTGLLIETAILYCDMRGSSLLTEDHRRGTAARIYRSFLNAVVDIGTYYFGQIRAFDGDRVMMLFDADRDAFRSAIQAAIEIQSVLHDRLNPIFLRCFKREIHCGIGIAYGPMLAVRVGGRGRSMSGIVWVGEAANIAAKFADDAEPGHVVVSSTVYENLPDEFKSPSFLALLGDDLWTRDDILAPKSFTAEWQPLLEHGQAADEEATK